MKSITFVTDIGTEIEVRNIQYAETLDVVQAAVVGLETVENILNEGGTLDEGGVITSGLYMGGGVSIAMPPVDGVAEDEDEDEETDTSKAKDQIVEAEKSSEGLTLADPTVYISLLQAGAIIAKEQSNVAEGWYRCGGCGEVHNIEDVLAVNDELGPEQRQG